MVRKRDLSRFPGLVAESHQLHEVTMAMFLHVKRNGLKTRKQDFRRPAVSMGEHDWTHLVHNFEARITRAELEALKSATPTVMIVERYSITFELREAYRTRKGSRNRYLWNRTVKGEHIEGASNVARRARRVFWKALDEFIANESPSTILRIRQQAEAVIARPEELDQTNK